MKKHGYLLDQSSTNGHYSYTKKDNVVKLFYSSIGDWSLSTKGKLAIELISDDQTGLFTAKFQSGLEITLDICQLAELVEAAKVYHKCGTRNTFTKYKVFKEIK